MRNKKKTKSLRFMIWYLWKHILVIQVIQTLSSLTTQPSPALNPQEYKKKNKNNVKSLRYTILHHAPCRCLFFIFFSLISFFIPLLFFLLFYFFFFVLSTISYEIGI